jgi:hypothetical protein
MQSNWAFPFFRLLSFLSATVVLTPADGRAGPRWRGFVRNKTPATKVEKVESEPRFGTNIGDYSGRLRLLSGANKANLRGDALSSKCFTEKELW